MIKPIRSSSDLSVAKGKLSSLLLSNTDGEHDDEIEVLSVLVERFEAIHFPIDAPSAVAAIRFRTEQMGLTSRQLEPFIGSRARVSEILSGKRQLSIEMIRSLHEGLGIPYESLISVRPEHRHDDLFSATGISQLNSLGLVFRPEEFSEFRNLITHRDANIALHKKTRTPRAASRMDQVALLLWQVAVLKKSEAMKIERKFEKDAFGADILRKIARLSTRSDGPNRAIKMLRSLGVPVVVLPPLPGTFLDGAAMMGRTGNPVVGLTLRHDRVDGFWFTLLHELAHVSLHYEQLLDRSAVFVDDMEINSEDVFERQADDLARESLIPQSLVSQVRWDGMTTHDEIVALAIRARVHVAIAAGRWQRDHQNYKKFARLIERGTVRFQTAQGRDEIDASVF